MKKLLLTALILTALVSCKKENNYSCEVSYTPYETHFNTATNQWIYCFGAKQTSTVEITGNDELIDDYISTNSRPINNTGDSADVLIEVVCKEI